MGRQLGVTKAVSMKLHMNELEKNIKKEISLVQDKGMENNKNQESQFKNLQTEISQVGSYVPKIEKLEKDLELIDQSTDFKDPELDGMVASMNKVLAKSKSEITKKHEIKEKKQQEEAKKEQDAEYAFTPKEGFNWDDVSSAIDLTQLKAKGFWTTISLSTNLNSIGLM